MLPQTHFLFAFLIGLLFAKFGYFTLSEAFLAGFISIIIDLDVLFVYLIKHKEFSIRKAWNSSIINHEHEKALIHRWPGFIAATLLFIILANYFLIPSLILIIAYYSHFLLDHLHIKTKKKFVLHEYGFVIKLFYFELIFQLICLILVILLFFI